MKTGERRLLVLQRLAVSRQRWHQRRQLIFTDEAYRQLCAWVLYGSTRPVELFGDTDED